MAAAMGPSVSFLHLGSQPQTRECGETGATRAESETETGTRARETALGQQQSRRPSSVHCPPPLPSPCRDDSGCVVQDDGRFLLTAGELMGRLSTRSAVFASPLAAPGRRSACTHFAPSAPSPDTQTAPRNPALAPGAGACCFVDSSTARNGCPSRGVTLRQGSRSPQQGSVTAGGFLFSLPVQVVSSSVLALGRESDY